MLTRGIKKEIDDFITRLQGLYLPFDIMKDGTFGLKKGRGQVQVQVRPIQLWEVVFPEEHLDIMLNTCLGGREETQHPQHKKWVWALRKALGVKPIPKFKKDKKFPHTADHAEIVGIGIKEDGKLPCGTEAL